MSSSYIVLTWKHLKQSKGGKRIQKDHLIEGERERASSVRDELQWVSGKREEKEKTWVKRDRGKTRWEEQLKDECTRWTKKHV